MFRCNLLICFFDLEDLFNFVNFISDIKTLEKGVSVSVVVGGSDAVVGVLTCTNNGCSR